MYQRKKKNEKTAKTSKESLKSSKAYEISRGIKTAKKLLIPKKNDKGECITSRKGIADVFGEFYKRLFRGQRER